MKVTNNYFGVFCSFGILFDLIGPGSCEGSPVAEVVVVQTLPSEFVQSALLLIRRCIENITVIKLSTLAVNFYILNTVDPSVPTLLKLIRLPRTMSSSSEPSEVLESES